MSNTLMNKTKKELVDIVFRKDNVYKKLKNDYNTLQNKFNISSNTNEQLRLELNRLNVIIKDENHNINNLHAQINEFRDACDEYASKNQELVDKYDKLKNIVIGVSYFIIVLIIMLILL